MKIKFTLVLCSLITFMLVYSQDNTADTLSQSMDDSIVDLIDGSTYKNATLYTQAGNTMQGDIIVRGDSVTIEMKGTKVSLDASLQKIQRIDVPVEPELSDQLRYTIKNSAIGFGTGLATSVTTTLVYQRTQTKTRTYNGGIPWHCNRVENGSVTQKWEYGVITETTISGEYKMILEPWIKIGLVVLPTTVGFLKGFFKKELKTIYSTESEALNRIDYHMYYNPYFNNMNFSLSYRF